MRRRNKSKNNLLILLLVLIVLGVGIGYAVLSERLTIDNTISYDSMKWDVGFTAAEDGWESLVDEYIELVEEEYGSTLEEMGMTREDIIKELSGDSVNVLSTVSISQDKKSITVECDLEMTSKNQFCLVKASISNDSTFNIKISELLTEYDHEYIETLSLFWFNHSVFDFDTDVLKNQTLSAGEIADVMILVFTNELDEDMLPSTDLSVPISVSLGFEETDMLLSDLAMLSSRKYDYAFWSDGYREKIKNITFEDKINVPSNAVESWDISLGKTGKVMSYVVPNKNDSSYYDLYIQSDTQLYANIDMRNWFMGFVNLDAINGLGLLDTSYTTNMYGMFMDAGRSSTNFSLDVSCFDTSNVTNMSYMFYNTGYNNKSFTLDVSNFDTSNVTDMSLMFFYTGVNSTEFSLDLSGFDTSNVIDMTWMLMSAGKSSTKFVTSITIRNPNLLDYSLVFDSVALKSGTKITVNYTSETERLVDDMIATTSSNSNVVKGVRVD